MSDIRNVFVDRVVGLVASLAGIFSYIAFRDSVWGFAIGLGMAYTVFVLGGVVAEKVFYSKFLAVQLSWGKIALVHIGFLVVVVGFIWALFYIRSLDADAVPIKQGHLNWDLLIAIVVAILLGSLEKWIILGKREAAA